MNNDLISREALKNALMLRQWYIDDIDEVMKIIDNAPTVDISETISKFRNTAYQNGVTTGLDKRQHGEWEEPFEHNGKMYHKCNRCHISSPFMVIDNYCSYCGAKMKGDKNDQEVSD